MPGGLSKKTYLAKDLESQEQASRNKQAEMEGARL